MGGEVRTEFTHIHTADWSVQAVDAVCSRPQRFVIQCKRFVVVLTAVSSALDQLEQLRDGRGRQIELLRKDSDIDIGLCGKTCESK